MHFGHKWKIVKKGVGSIKWHAFGGCKERSIIELQRCSCGKERAVVMNTNGIVWKGDPLLIKGLEEMKEVE